MKIGFCGTMSVGKTTIVNALNVIDVMAFTRLAKSIPYYVADDLCQAASYLIKEYDYIFYISPKGIEIEDNGVRTIDPEYRKKVDFEIKGLLNKYASKNQRIVKLKGSTEERIQKVKQTLFP